MLASIAFDDKVCGRIEQDLAREIGDFVLRRADGCYSYQLAVVVDDAEQGINDVVRGADLLDSTPRQILLQRLLGLPTPRYLHLPLALDEHGRKLSKHDQARPVDPADPLPALRAALTFLGQQSSRAATRQGIPAGCRGPVRRLKKFHVTAIRMSQCGRTNGRADRHNLRYAIVRARHLSLERRTA